MLARLTLYPLLKSSPVIELGSALASNTGEGSVSSSAFSDAVTVAKVTKGEDERDDDDEDEGPALASASGVGLQSSLMHS